MKTFDEWFEEKYGYLGDDYEAITIYKSVAMGSWQAAQEIQRESDKKVIEDYIQEISSISSTDKYSIMSHNTGCIYLYNAVVKINNNKETK